MNERYSIEELATLTEEGMIRRQFVRQNLSWLSLVVLGLASLFFVFLVSMRLSKVTLPFGAYEAVSINILLNLVICLVAQRLLHRTNLASSMNGWIIAFLILQYAMVVHGFGFVNWVLAGGFVLVLCKFRFSWRQTVLLHLFIALTIVVYAITNPVGKGGSPTSATNLGAASVVLLLIAAAFGLQWEGTRRIRREILEEWAEPLRNAREQIRMRGELQYARELQLSMLPDAPPDLAWIDLAASSQPATEVGGDYYDYFAFDGKLAVVCSDVAGHGVPSAIALASLQTGFRLMKETLIEPDTALQRLHELIAQSRRRTLVTASVLLLQPEAGRAVIAAAAHPPVLVKRQSGDVETVDLQSLPLGVRLPARIARMELSISRGDTFVLHTDGLYETRNESGEIYGLDRLANILREHPTNGSADGLLRRILDDVAAFRGSATQDDDVTVVVARLV